MKRYLLAHDLGTSGNKATLFTLDGKLVSSKVSPYETRYEHDVWAEQNPDDWWKAVCRTSKELTAKIDKAEIAAVAFSGQMMGCVCVDSHGRPLRNSIIYSDQRAVEETATLLRGVSAEDVYQITGHRASASYSIEKLMWVKAHQAEIYRDTFRMLNAKDYMNLKLTGRFVTEYNDASGTNALDLRQKVWSSRILDAAGIDGAKLPDLVQSISVIGEVTKAAAEETGLKAGTPVVAGAGDGGCATVGVGSVAEGVTYNYLGSSSWISTSTKEPIFDESQRTFTWVHPVPGLFQPCGTMQTAGSAFDWLREQVCRWETDQAHVTGRNPFEILNEELLKSPAGANGMMFLPYLLGERSPRWNPKAKGAWIGAKLDTKREDLIRSVVEGIGFNLEIILAIMKELTRITEITLIGGGAQGRAWRQILASIFGLPVLIPEYLEEATSMGAAIIGGVGAGLFPDFEVAHRFVRIVERVEPEPLESKTYNAKKPLFNAYYTALEPVFATLE